MTRSPSDRLSRLYLRIYALTPRGRREKRILTNPDVQAGLTLAEREIARWDSTLDTRPSNWP